MVRNAVIVALLFVQFTAIAQAIEGTVIDADTEQPIAFANVFFSGTLLGTTSGTDGRFTLPYSLNGKYDLIVSYVGYQEYIHSFDAADKASFLEVLLIPDVKTLAEIRVSADTTGWKNNYDSFKPLFLGETTNAQKVDILNPRDIFLYFDAQDRALFAHARKELVIENQALGYRIDYIMKAFEMDYPSGRFASFGIPRFQAIVPKNKMQENRWAKEREKAYNGSFQHFLMAVKANQILEEGFVVHELHKVPNRKRPPQALIDGKLAKFRDVLQSEVSLSHSPAMDSVRYWRRLQRMPAIIDSLGVAHLDNSLLVGANGNFIFQGYLELIYKNEPEEPFFARSRPGGGIDSKQTTTVQVLDEFTVYENGYYDVSKLFFNGYMGWASRIAEMLPLEYQPAKD